MSGVREGLRRGRTGRSTRGRSINSVAYERIRGARGPFAPVCAQRTHWISYGSRNDYITMNNRTWDSSGRALWWSGCCITVSQRRGTRREQQTVNATSVRPSLFFASVFPSPPPSRVSKFLFVPRDTFFPIHCLHLIASSFFRRLLSYFCSRVFFLALGYVVFPRIYFHLFFLLVALCSR